MKYVLAIAGSDSCGGAGIQADIKTIASLGAHPLTAITAVTAQNSRGVADIHNIPVRFISRQIETILEDVTPDAVKIGMLMTGAIIKTIANVLKKRRLSNLVVDPVMRSSTGRNLLEPEAVEVLKDHLLPLARVVTPNIQEAGILAGKEIKDLKGMERASRNIKDFGPDVVITGGHLKGKCTDILFDGETIIKFPEKKLKALHTHGSGCVFSSAMATYLAIGYNVPEATKLAHDFTRGAIRSGYPCGHGEGVVFPGWS